MLTDKNKEFMWPGIKINLKTLSQKRAGKVRSYDKDWGLCKKDCEDNSPQTTNNLKEAQIVLFSPSGT